MSCCLFLKEGHIVWFISYYFVIATPCSVDKKLFNMEVGLFFATVDIYNGHRLRCQCPQNEHSFEVSSSHGHRGNSPSLYLGRLSSENAMLSLVPASRTNVSNVV